MAGKVSPQPGRKGACVRLTRLARKRIVEVRLDGAILSDISRSVNRKASRAVSSNPAVRLDTTALDRRIKHAYLENGARKRASRSEAYEPHPAKAGSGDSTDAVGVKAHEKRLA